MQADNIYREQEEVRFDFSEKNIRLGFIRKVYLILSTQLTITAVIIGVGLALRRIEILS